MRTKTKPLKEPKLTDFNPTLREIEEEVPIVTDKFGGVKEKKKHNKLGWINKWKLKKHPEKSYLINMRFSNGTCKEFVIVTKSETFRYMKRDYFLRYENAYFNLTQNLYELSFFDDHPVPIDRAIKKIGDTDYFTVTPENLKDLLGMEYVKVLASSQQLDSMLKTIGGILAFVLLLTLGILFFLFNMSKKLGVTL